MLQTFRNFCAIILVACSLFMSKIRCKIFTKVKHANCFSNFEWQLRIMLKKICTIFNCFYSSNWIGLWKSLAIHLLKNKTKYPKCERCRNVKMQATPLAEKQQQFGTWSYKTDEKNVLKKQVLLENTWVGDKCNGYEKKIEEKETFEKTIGCVMHQVGTSRSNKEGAAARWWGELRIWSPLTFPTSST